MLRLNLSREPEWLELAPGLRLLLAPMSTALMMAARADPALQDLPEEGAERDPGCEHPITLPGVTKYPGRNEPRDYAREPVKRRRRQHRCSTRPPSTQTMRESRQIQRVDTH